MEFIKGGFPKLILKEYVKQENTAKPREFNNKDIISINEILDAKKRDLFLDLPFASISEKEYNQLDFKKSSKKTSIKKIKPMRISKMLNKLDNLKIKSKKNNK